MIGPLRLTQITLHLGYDPLCLCCCAGILAVAELETGGKRFFKAPPISFKRPQRKAIENPFIQFTPILPPLETNISEDGTIDEVEVADHLNVLSRADRAAVDGLPDKAEAGAPHVVFPGQAHIADDEGRIAGLE